MGIHTMNGGEWPESYQDPRQGRVTTIVEYVKRLLAPKVQPGDGLEIGNGRMWTGGEIVHQGDPMPPKVEQ